MGEGRVEVGGIYGLLDIFDAHRGALEHDFRTRFQRGLTAIPSEIGWGEAVRLVRIIRSDPSSELAAAMEGWDHAVSREAAVLMDLWDLESAKSGARRPPKYPRVWKKAGDVQKLGDAAGRSREEVLTMLGRPTPPD